MSLSFDDARTILKLLDETELAEIRLEIGDLKLYARKEPEALEGSEPSRQATPIAATQPKEPPVSAAVQKPPAEPARAVAPEESIPPGLVAVRAPMLGVFYRAPSPGAEPFAKEGDVVKSSDTLFMIEVMKLFNSVTAGANGRIVRFLVENNTLVEFNQAVALIDPSI